MARGQWTSQEYFDLKAQIERDLRLHFPDDSPELLSQLSSGSNFQSGDDKQLLHELIRIFLMLELQTREPLMTGAEVGRVLATANAILSAAGINPRRSQLSFLYQDLQHLEAEITGNAGRYETSAWITAASEHLSHQPSASQTRKHALMHAKGLLRLGHATNARRVVQDVITGKASPEELGVMGRCDWLTGNAGAGAAFLKETAVTEEGELSEMIDIFRARNSLTARNFLHRKNLSPQNAIILGIWLYTLPNNSARQAALRSASLQRRYGQAKLRAAKANLLLNALQAVERAYENSTPLATRLSDLGQVFENRRNLPELHQELIVLGAIIRFATRYSQMDLLELCICEYRATCRRLSANGADPLDLTTDIKEQPSEITAYLSNYRSEGRFRRIAAVSGLAGKGVTLWASTRLRSLFSQEFKRQELEERALLEMAEYTLNVLGDLKGGFQKIGQIIANSSPLSETAAKDLRLLNAQAKPTDPAKSIRILEEDLGNPLSSLFDVWHEQPVAVGSIGQVFSAETRRGDRVAVKIQHPGIQKSLEHDCRILSWVSQPLKILMPASNVNKILEEIVQRVMAEADYALEASSQEALRTILSANSDIIVPKVFKDLSAGRVLTMEYIEGQSFDEFCASANQDQRNNAAEKILKAYTFALFRGYYFNADPHPGNFIFLEDGRIALLDFGCTKIFSPEYAASLEQCFRSIITGSSDLNHQSWVDLGYIEPGNRETAADLFQHLRKIFNLIAQDAPVVLDRKLVTKIGSLQLESSLRRKVAFPPEAAMLSRFTWGLLTTVAMLEPELNFKHLLEQAALAGEPAHPLMLSV